MECLANPPKALSIVTGVCVVAAFALLCVAVGTDYWLISKDQLDENRTKTAAAYSTSHSGLWKICTVDVAKGHVEICSYINYFKSQERDETQRVTDAILLSVRKATLFPLVSLLILLIGEVIFFIGHWNQRGVFTFLAGILFVVAGLCTLIGIVTYISAVTEEAGNKPKSTMDDPKFLYWYGPSFALTVSSFVTSELTGVLSVYLYIVQYKTAFRKKQDRIAMTDSNDRHSSSSRGAGGRTGSRGPSANHSASNSEPNYSYVPVVELANRELSSYILAREAASSSSSRQGLTAAAVGASGAAPPPSSTLSVDAQVHIDRDRSSHSVREADSYHRTTLV